MKILIVDDDQGTTEQLQTVLTNQQYLVESAADGETGWSLVEAFDYDVILLDIQLPKLDGISFCKQLRARGDPTPVLLLTAEENSYRKVTGLDAGADDYVVKPYDVEELCARIRALLRRGGAPLSPTLKWNGLCLDPSNCEVTYQGRCLTLTAREYSLLELFLRNTQRIFSQSVLIDRLWSLADYPTENTVRAHIKSLRQKLKTAGADADFIETVYGLGYRLKTSNNDAVSSPKPKGSKTQAAKVSPASHPSTPFPAPNLAEIWARTQEKYGQRVAVVEKAVTALQNRTCTPELQQAAQREAHTLKGSLGSFGLLEAEQLSREIEQRLHTGISEEQTQISELAQLVQALRQALEQPLNIESSSTTILPQQSARLLIVDDDRELANLICVEATRYGLRTETVSSLSQARTAIAYKSPNIILLDLSFPDPAEHGLILLQELTRTQSPIPVVVFTGTGKFSDRLEVARLGAQGFLQKPTSPTQVLQTILQVLASSNPPAAKLLIVDDDAPLLDVLSELLHPWGFRVTLLADSKQFWRVFQQTQPDLLILDVEMPDLNGIELCQVVRNDPRWSNLPILFLSAHSNPETIFQVFTAGADDFVHKPIVGPELVARILTRLERIQILRKMVTANLMLQGEN